MVLRDLDGSGWETRGGKVLEEALIRALTSNGWQRDSVAAIVIEPEIEAWLRFRSLHLHSLVKQRARRSQQMTELLFPDVVKDAINHTGGEAAGKPHRPKETFETLLQEFGIPRSNALYKELAARESLDACSVDSFNRFKTQLQAWFSKA
ncbi:MAG: hypothetical protein L0Z50_29985 [Verrucomicrobiales bacterium]|nr:hypothetical protein [Verrucomicrobiales bacterium]